MFLKSAPILIPFNHLIEYPLNEQHYVFSHPGRTGQTFMAKKKETYFGLDSFVYHDVTLGKSFSFGGFNFLA